MYELNFGNIKYLILYNYFKLVELVRLHIYQTKVSWLYHNGLRKTLRKWFPDVPEYSQIMPAFKIELPSYFSYFHTEKIDEEPKEQIKNSFRHLDFADSYNLIRVEQVRSLQADMIKYAFENIFLLSLDSTELKSLSRYPTVSHVCVFFLQYLDLDKASFFEDKDFIKMRQAYKDFILLNEKILSNLRDEIQIPYRKFPYLYSGLLEASEVPFNNLQQYQDVKIHLQLDVERIKTKIRTVIFMEGSNLKEHYLLSFRENQSLTDQECKQLEEEIEIMFQGFAKKLKDFGKIEDGFKGRDKSAR